MKLPVIKTIAKKDSHKRTTKDNLVVKEWTIDDIEAICGQNEPTSRLSQMCQVIRQQAQIIQLQQQMLECAADKRQELENELLEHTDALNYAKGM